MDPDATGSKTKVAQRKNGTGRAMSSITHATKKLLVKIIALQIVMTLDISMVLINASVKATNVLTTMIRLFVQMPFSSLTGKLARVSTKKSNSNAIVILLTSLLVIPTTNVVVRT
jgi:hypothetical protein